MQWTEEADGSKIKDDNVSFSRQLLLYYYFCFYSTRKRFLLVVLRSLSFPQYPAVLLSKNAFYSHKTTLKSD